MFYTGEQQTQQEIHLMLILLLQCSYQNQGRLDKSDN